MSHSTSTDIIITISAKGGRFFYNGFDLAILEAVKELILMLMLTIMMVQSHATKSNLVLTVIHNYILVKVDMGVLYMSDVDIELLVLIEGKEVRWEEVVKKGNTDGTFHAVPVRASLFPQFPIPTTYPYLGNLNLNYLPHLEGCCLTCGLLKREGQSTSSGYSNWPSRFMDECAWVVPMEGDQVKREWEKIGGMDEDEEKGRKEEKGMRRRTTEE